MNDECFYCKRHYHHDGKCNGRYGSVPCLAYERDPRGRKKSVDNVRFEIPIRLDMPEVGKPCDYWNVKGVAKTITITKINRVEWHKTRRGLQGIRMWANMWFWSHENGEIPPEKPKLRLVKTEGKDQCD